MHRRRRRWSRSIQKVAIFGAAGAIGHAIAPELQRRGVPFRVVGRSKEKLERAFGGFSNAEVFAADIAEMRSAGAAARGVDTIFYCVGLPYPSHNLHPVLMRTTLEAAASVGVERIVLVSSVYPYGVPRTPKVAEDHLRFPDTRKGAYRREQEDLVLDAHKKGKIAGVIVHLPDFYGPHAELGYAPLLFQAALAGKTANWVGPVSAKHEFVFVPDTGPVIVELASREDCFGEAWNYGGPGEITVIDFITRVYRALGREPKYRSVGRRLLSMLGWFDANLREVVEMIYLQETPVILNDSKLASKMGELRKTSYDEGIRETLAWMRQNRE